MIYRIEVDGTDIFAYSKELTLLEPKLTITLNEAGSLEFTMPASHLYYDLPNLMTSDINVYEEDNLIWYGRILEYDVAINKDKTIRCEGALSFFNDSVFKPRTYQSTDIHTLFRDVIAEHNGQVSANRQFTIGDITVDNDELSVELDYATTKDILDNTLMKLAGGYLITRKVGLVNYIDWVSSLTNYGSQPVEFGLNLVDISKHLSGSGIYTSIIPLGKEVDGKRTTIEDVNQGFDYIDSEYIDVFGRITRIVEFSDISAPSELLLAARRWLDSQNFDPIRIECEAAELHYLYPDRYSPFIVGQNVHVTSTPHNIDAMIPVTSLTISLDNPVKKVSIGFQERTNITDYI